MPRVSKEQSNRNRAAIREISARLFRERGINGVSVSDLMGAAGLTHGGFYGHFTSKDALAADACGLAFEHSAERWKQRAGESVGADAARTALIDGYLSLKARGSPGDSCPATALAGDVARENPDAPVRAAFGAGVEGLVDILGSVERKGDAGADRRAALADFSTMVGALILARATVGRGISGELLSAARERLGTGPGPAVQRKPVRRPKR